MFIKTDLTAMRFIFLILLPTMIFEPEIQAQTPQKLPEGKRIKVMVNESSFGFKTFSNYYYDNTNQLYKELWMTDDSLRYSENFFTYPSKNLVEKKRIFSFDSLTSIEKLYYDDNGRLISQEISRSDGPSGKTDHMYEDGKLVRSNAVFMNGWLNGVVNYIYEDNKLKEAIITIDNVERGRVRYECDAEGSIIAEKYEMGSWNQSFIYFYERTDCPKHYYSNPFIRMPCDLLVESEFYSYSGKIGGPSEYKYNDKNQLMEKVYTMSDSMKVRTTFQYDDGNRIISSVRKFPGGNEMVYSYRYDARNNLVSREFVDQDSIIGYELFYYDRNDRLVKAVYENTDYWIYGEMDVRYNLFEEVGEAVIKRGRMKGTKVNFGYLNGLLVYIQWIFTDENFQEYIYSYKKADP